MCGLPSNKKSSSHKTWQTSLLFLKPLQIQNLNRKKWEGHRILCSPILKKWGDTSSVSPTKLRPWSGCHQKNWQGLAIAEITVKSPHQNTISWLLIHSALATADNGGKCYKTISHVVTANIGLCVPRQSTRPSSSSTASKRQLVWNRALTNATLKIPRTEPKHSKKSLNLWWCST